VLAIRGSYDRAITVSEAVAGANISRDVARIAPLEPLRPTFLRYYLVSPPAADYLRRHARGVAVKGVNIGDLRRMPVPVPPLDEQDAIINELERQLSLIDMLSQTVAASHRHGASLRASILAAAFSGRLVPQDPTDEPASVLLE